MVICPFYPIDMSMGQEHVKSGTSGVQKLRNAYIPKPMDRFTSFKVESVEFVYSVYLCSIIEICAYAP